MKKSFRKTTFLSALAIAVPAMGMAQDKVEASVGADFVRHRRFQYLRHRLLVQWRSGVFSLRLTQYQPYLRGTNRL